MIKIHARICGRAVRIEEPINLSEEDLAKTASLHQSDYDAGGGTRIWASGNF